MSPKDYKDTKKPNPTTTASTNTKASIREMTPEQTAETIKKIARNIRDASARMRETVKTLRQSGAIDELTQAVHEATIAARDTTREISDTAKDLKERGVIKDTASAVEETTIAARETAQVLKESARETAESAPVTADTVKEAASKIKSRTKGTRTAA
jgi:uncharacterized protein YjgD (DUF1641 family)